MAVGLIARSSNCCYCNVHSLYSIASDSQSIAVLTGYFKSAQEVAVILCIVQFNEYEPFYIYCGIREFC